MGTLENEVLPPLAERSTILRWMRRNLFPNWVGSLVTIVMAYVIFVTARAIVRWVVNEGQWQVIATNMELLMVGQYPRPLLWRIWVSLGLMGALTGVSWGVWGRRRLADTMLVVGMPFIFALLPFDPATRLNWIIIGCVTVGGYVLGRRFPQTLSRATRMGWLAFVPLVVVLVRGVTGGAGPLSIVTTNLWGGLLLTLLIGGIGMTLSFPLGVLLAIGRRFGYPVIRGFCVVYIELIRAVPLITVLFMAQTTLPLLLPDRVEIDRVVRAMTAFTLFSAAYMAENVRGGLQAIPKGQYEAAAALGLNGYQSLRMIILPQALRSIIPILTASAIGGFRDTSLVLIVGLLDVLGIAKATLAQPDFLGRHIEVYSFLAALYWALSYAMSYVGQLIEERMGVQESTV